MKPPRPLPSATQRRMTRSAISAIWLWMAEVWSKEAATLTVMKLVYPRRDIFSVRLFWGKKSQETRCEQLTSYAAVRNGHLNFRFINSFWHVDSPSVGIRWGSAGRHRSPSTHAPRTNQITLLSCIAFEHIGWNWEHRVNQWKPL